MTLQQNQIWKKRAVFIRITRLERWEVAYKEMTDLEAKVGSHHVLPKKEFCRLIRGATLLAAETATAKPEEGS
jgi:hypothetical protein